ncbi:O-antigen ligase family protein [Chitinibacter fontanus]|uniref:O-antigen ligase family protein n=1 Tax=Chitinibacter fontanus TaxID=1737446 RepID=A0A7D5V9S1_9NEIS|nr:O-antigen ligase family protein [Chitinibacter fontanus]QLI81140.1 O-antigen ligase family protein [Chitinibacter fontanus]
MSQNWKSYMQQWPLLLPFLLGGALPTSTALTNLLLPLCALIGAWQGRALVVRILKTQPIVWFSLALLMALALGALRADPAQGMEYLGKYKKLLFVPFLALFFIHDKARLRAALIGFLVGSALILFASTYLRFVGSVIDPTIPSMRLMVLNGHTYLSSGITKNPIAQSLLMAIAAFLALAKALQSLHYRRLAWGILSLWMLLNVFMMSPQRTGYLAVLIMLIWAGSLWLGWRARLMAIGLGVAIASALWFGQASIVNRVALGFTEAKTCWGALHTPQQDALCATSLGLRTYWYTTAIEHIAEKPFLGYGTGNFSIPTLATSHFSNAHNEYLMQGMQLGLVGIILYLSLLIAGIRAALRLADPWRTILSGILVAYAVCSLFNSLLLDFTEGYTLVTVLAVVLALAIHTANSSNSSESKASHV